LFLIVAFLDGELARLKQQGVDLDLFKVKPVEGVEGYLLVLKQCGPRS
jgi:hypothetical protein